MANSKNSTVGCAIGFVIASGMTGKSLNVKGKTRARLGVDHGHAYVWSRTRMGGWAVAQSPILVTTITLERLRKRGYEPMLEHYFKVSPQFNEPLYTRPVRTVV